MKRLLVTILALLYLGTSTGATIHLHYCMGKLVAMNLWHSEAGKCSNCGMKKNKACSKKCCKDEHKLVKLEKDQRKATEDSFKSAYVIAEKPVTFIDFPQPYIASVINDHPVSHAPPLSILRHILYCSLRI